MRLGTARSTTTGASLNIFSNKDQVRDRNSDLCIRIDVETCEYVKCCLAVKYKLREIWQRYSDNAALQESAKIFRFLCGTDNQIFVFKVTQGRKIV